MSDDTIKALFAVAAVVILGGLLWTAFNKLTGRGRVAMVCPACGTQGTPATLTKGSMLVELLAWLLFIIPGLFYSLWRVSSRVQVCPACRLPGMIPASSPNGRKIVEQME